MNKPKAKKGGKPMQTDTLSNRLTLRVDPETRREWQQRAKEEQRPLSNWVVWMVSRVMKEESEKGRS